jgi:hypothetical protein
VGGCAGLWLSETRLPGEVPIVGLVNVVRARRRGERVDARTAGLLRTYHPGVAGTRCGLRCARFVAILIGLGAAAGAAVSAAQIATAPEFLRSFRWPLPVAVASQLLAFSLLILVGALMHPAVILVAALPAAGQVLGDYESENLYLPALALAVVLLLLVYRRKWGRLRSLGVVRLSLLALATVAAIGGVIAMQAPPQTLRWYRYARPAGDIELQTFMYEGPCGPASAGGTSLLGQGCDIVIPARRARFVIGYSTLSVLLGVAAVAGAREDQAGT